jgi:anti-sigma factor RsiW
MTDATNLDEIDDAIIIALSDYLDGALTGAAKTDVETKIASDPTWKAAHAEMVDSRDATATLSGLQKARAPVNLAEDVTQTIHKRSAGRFFGKRTFGDRVPFLAILVVAILGLAAIGYVMYSSQTGSLKVDKPSKPPQPTPPVVNQP